MDNQQKEALRQSRPFLVDNLIVDDLWDYLIEQDIFSTVMLEQIMVKQLSSFSGGGSGYNGNNSYFFTNK